MPGETMNLLSQSIVVRLRYQHLRGLEVETEMSSNLLQLLQIERLLVNPTIQLAIDLYSSQRLFKDLLIEFVLTKLEVCLKFSEIWVINKNLQSAIFSRLWLSCNLSGSCRRFRLVIFLLSCITA